MILATDVYYNPDGSANASGVLFDWEDDIPIKTFSKTISEVSAYEPGSFYKRELPCIMKLIELVDLQEITSVLIDGHVFISNDNAYGLGGYLWEALAGKISVIGVAKRGFYNNKETVVQVHRGTSNTPLHISAIGMDTQLIAQKIKAMHGKYRIPTILKIVDQLSREKNNSYARYK